MKSFKLRVALPLLLVLTTLVYLPGLPGPLLLDDRNNLAPLAAIDEGQLGAWEFITGRPEGSLFRPVAKASFWLDWWLWGDNTVAFKTVNLLIHLLCGLAVYLLARALLRRAFSEQPAHAIEAAALFACAMWLLAPLLVSTVLYCVQRMAQLATLFTLLGLAAYVHGRERRSSRWIALALLVLWPLAVLSKENGALLPLLAALIEWWWLTVDGPADPSDPSAWRWRAVLLVCIALPALALSLLIAFDPQWLLGGYREREFTLVQRLVTQAPILLDYLGNLLLWPGASEMSVFRDDYPASTTLFTPAITLPAIAFWMALIGTSIALRRSGALRRAVGFAALFFVSAHLVESSVFALELYFEHRNYLPAFAVFFALASCGLWLLRHVRARMVATLGVVLVLGCALLSAQRSLLWGNEELLYLHATRTHPQSARAWQALAGTQFADNRFDEALASLAHSARIMGPAAQIAITLQGIAAYCVAERAIPAALWQQLRDAPVLAADRFTVNALAWTARALHAGVCRAGDRARLQQLLAGKPRASSAGSRTTLDLRDAHLRHLLDAR